jgi:hypothetical protein
MDHFYLSVKFNGGRALSARRALHLAALHRAAQSTSFDFFKNGFCVVVNGYPQRA